MIKMTLLKIPDANIYKCAFYEYKDGSCFDINIPIMIIADYELEHFYNMMKEEKKNLTEDKK